MAVAMNTRHHRITNLSSFYRLLGRKSHGVPSSCEDPRTLLKHVVGTPGQGRTLQKSLDTAYKTVKLHENCNVKKTNESKLTQRKNPRARVLHRKIAMRGLTDSQKSVLEFFTSFHEKKKRTPTLGEIMRGLNLTHYSSARQCLVALEEKGYLTRVGGPWARRAWRPAKKEAKDAAVSPSNAGSILSLADVPRQREKPIRLDKRWMNDLLGEGMHPGGLFLVAGDPGIGKTTFVLQLAASLAKKGIESLILLSEQTVGELKRRAEAVIQKRALFKSIKAVEGKYVEKLEEVFALIEKESSGFSGIKALFIDSIQGLGLTSPHRQRWEPLFQLLKRAKNRRISVFLIGHVTKMGVMAGPRALEHEVDVFIHAKRLVNFRVFFVPKNRFGPTSRILLQMNRHGILEPVVESNANIPIAITKGLTWELGIVEVQARVEAAPWLGTGRQIPSGGVARKQLVKVMGILKNLGFDFLSLQTEVQALIPGAQALAPPDLDSPLAVSLVASYVQRSVPTDVAFSGELDLLGNIISGKPSIESVGDLKEQAHTIGVKTVFCSPESGKALNKLGAGLNVVEVRNLREILHRLWPGFFAEG